MITIRDQFIPGPDMITIFRHLLYITKISVLEQLKSIVFCHMVDFRGPGIQEGHSRAGKNY
jgi:hypothetical protein